MYFGDWLRQLRVATGVAYRLKREIGEPIFRIRIMLPVAEVAAVAIGKNQWVTPLRHAYGGDGKK